MNYTHVVACAIVRSMQPTPTSSSPSWSVTALISLGAFAVVFGLGQLFFWAAG